jgi:hypothetical protein
VEILEWIIRGPVDKNKIKNLTRMKFLAHQISTGERFNRMLRTVIDIESIVGARSEE